MDFSDYVAEVEIHYEKCWSNVGQLQKWEHGPSKLTNPRFFVKVFQPTAKRNMWTYATVGMSAPEDDDPIELHLFSSKEDHSLVELMTVIAYYHSNTHKLALNHTVNFGRPWQDASSCDHGLISLPFLDGPKLEKMYAANGVISFFWLIPVTKDEVEFKKTYGVEALERKFEEYEIDYLRPDRKSFLH